VTGAAGGIGSEIVRLLSHERTVIGLVQTPAQMPVAQAAGAAHCLVCDVTDSASVQSSVKAVTTIAGGDLSSLIICAAVQPVGVAEAIQRADFERLFATNVAGALEVIQGLLPSLRVARGRIVLFSSMAGKVATPLLGAYSATKFALEAIADVLRRELQATGVSVTVIEPGGVDTPMSGAQDELVRRALDALSPDMISIYGSQYRGYRELTRSALKHASRPADVAKIACDVATGKKRPRARYAVGNDARLMLTLAAILPTRWMDKLLGRVLAEK
jgi:NAD(P)-dependent dehydrogenase (short-subunit alcohol dehydrogenase family)